MIIPIKTMTINQIAERKDDLLISNDDIKELSRNVRNKVIDEFAKRLKVDYMDYDLYFIFHANNLLKPDESKKVYTDMIDEIAEQMKGGAEC